MTYTHVQFIGYTISTSPCDARWLDGPGGATLLQGHYDGAPSFEKDLKGRCRLLQKAIETARACAEAQEEPVEGKVLKVFVVPEFFFRHEAEGYLAGEQDKGLSRLRKKLAWLVRAKKWQDWFFVFGTALAHEEAGHKTGGKTHLNIALLQRGGLEMKGALVAAAPLNRVEPATELQPNPDYDADMLLDIDGVLVGMDLAVDHRDRGNRTGAPPLLPGLAQPQLLIRPSCGADWPSSKSKGTYVFQCDGQQVQCRLLNLRGTLVSPQDTTPVEAEKVPVGKLFASEDPGCLVSYAPVPLPEHRLVAGEVHRYTYPTPDGAYAIKYQAFKDSSGPLLILAGLEGAHRETGFYRLPCSLQLDHSIPPCQARIREAKSAASVGEHRLHLDFSCPPRTVNGIFALSQSPFAKTSTQ